MSAAPGYGAVELVVWSGTGNTRHVADRIARSARAQGADVTVEAAGVRTRTPQKPRTPQTPRLLGLMAPTHGFTAPWPLVKAALTHPDVRGADAFVLVTRGGTRIGGKTLAGFEGTAAYLPAGILALRGACVRGVGAIDMPLNWTVVVPSAGPQDVAAIVERGDAQTDDFAARILGGEGAFGGFAQLALGLLILPLSIGYMLIARLLLAKAFFADERCTSCGTCEKRCPQGAVRLRGAARRPYWSYDCENCMRCMSECPTEAIQGGQAWLVFYVWLMSLPVAAIAAKYALTALAGIGVSGGLIDGFTRLLSGYVWIVISVWSAYLMLWFGTLIPGVRWVLSRATLTRGYRRYRGPDQRSREPHQTESRVA